jgi:hypothetical protein
VTGEKGRIANGINGRKTRVAFYHLPDSSRQMHHSSRLFSHTRQVEQICDMKANYLYTAVLLFLLAAVLSGFSLMLKSEERKVELGSTVLAGSPIIVLNH